jgi:two-component system sensor histidine kinase RpfC
LGVIPQATLAAPIPEARPALALVENPYLDVRVVSDLQKLSPDPSFMARFASGFRDDAQRLTKEIQLAVNQQQYESTKDLAHALKGAAGSVGACRLLRIASKLERTGHDVLAQKADELIVELRQCVERTIAELETRIGSSECNSTPRTSDESRQDGAAAS